MQDAENRIENKRNLNEQHPKRCIMLQFLTVRAQRAHLLLRALAIHSQTRNVTISQCASAASAAFSSLLRAQRATRCANSERERRKRSSAARPIIVAEKKGEGRRRKRRGERREGGGEGLRAARRAHLTCERSELCDKVRKQREREKEEVERSEIYHSG